MDETPIVHDADEAATGLPGAPRPADGKFQHRRPLDAIARARFGPGMWAVIGVGAFIVVVSLGVFVVNFAGTFFAPPQRAVAATSGPSGPSPRPGTTATPYFSGTSQDEAGFGGVDPGPDGATATVPPRVSTRRTARNDPQPGASGVDFGKAVEDGQQRGAAAGGPIAAATIDPYAPSAKTRQLASGPDGVPDPQYGGQTTATTYQGQRQAIERDTVVADAARAERAPVEVSLSGTAAAPLRDQSGTGLRVSAADSSAPVSAARTPDPAYSGNPVYAASAARSSSIYTPDDIRTPAYPFAIFPGSSIPVRIYVPVDTQVAATTLPVFVDADVHDELNHKDVLLIPKGTRAMCSADTNVAPAQSRLTIVCNALVFANGYTRAIGAMALADAHGQIGIPGRVNNHAGAAYIAILPLALLGAAAQVASGPQQIVNGVQQQSVGQAITQNATGQLTQVGTAQIERKLSIPPTIHIDGGVPASIMVDRILGFSRPFPFDGSP
jgi:type IV secretory pathway VirB10-like protein